MGLLVNPNPDDPLVASIAETYQNDRYCIPLSPQNELSALHLGNPGLSLCSRARGLDSIYEMSLGLGDKFVRVVVCSGLW